MLVEAIGGTSLKMGHQQLTMKSQREEGQNRIKKPLKKPPGARRVEVKRTCGL